MTCKCTGRDTVRGDGGLYVRGKCHPRSWWGNVHPRRCWGDCHPRRCWGNCHTQGWRWDCFDCRPRGNAGWECRLSDGAFKDFSKVDDGLLLGVTELGKRGCRRWVGEGLCQGSRCDDGIGLYRKIGRASCSAQCPKHPPSMHPSSQRKP